MARKGVARKKDLPEAKCRCRRAGSTRQSSALRGGCYDHGGLTQSVCRAFPTRSVGNESQMDSGPGQEDRVSRARSLGLATYFRANRRLFIDVISGSRSTALRPGLTVRRLRPCVEQAAEPWCASAQWDGDR